MLVVARKTDLTSCPAHAKGEIKEGYADVEICYEPVARKGDEVLCLDGTIDVITEGEDTVIIGGQPIALKGHKTKHGGVILTGCPRVFIGKPLRGKCQLAAAEKRAAFITYSVKSQQAPFIDPESK